MSDPHPLVTDVRRFVQTEVGSVVADLEHADHYPHALVARLRAMGLFGCLIPADYAGLGLRVTTYARIIEELCRGWMSLAGVINSHTMAALIVLHHGTEEQRRRFLPRLATGEARGGLCLTEPHAGSDVQAIRTRAVRRGDEYVINGTKMFVTNGREGNTFALLAVTDAAAVPRHHGMSCFIVEKGHPGLRVAQSIGKLGYKGVDTAELVFEDVVVPATNLVGGLEGRGFRHVMSGLETGRINIAARAVGVAQAAFDAAMAHAGRTDEAPPALADMAARLQSARRLTYWAAGLKDRQERCDLEAGMAKLWASETAQTLAVEALQIHGPAGALLTSSVERLYRDSPLMIIGEGTNEIQRTLIARQLLARERTSELIPGLADSDERRLMVQTIRQFADKEIGPIVAEHDRAGRYPALVVAGLGDLGVLGALVPSSYGGLGLDLTTYAMIVEELARGWTTVAGVITAHATVAQAIAGFGSPEQRERWLPAMTRGETLGTAALVGDVTARREGTEYVLRGSATFVDNALRAHLFVVAARTDGRRQAAVLVPRDAAGFSTEVLDPTLGGRGLEPCRLVFHDVRVPLAGLLGDESSAERAVVGAQALARLGLAASAVGLGQAAFEAALRYSQQRSAFGQPICQHQAIQLKLADMATGVTAARLLTLDAGTRLEAGDTIAAGLAHLQSTRTAYEVALEAMRVHGGYGYTTDFPVERYYRDAARLLVALGDADGERADLARRLRGE